MTNKLSKALVAISLGAMLASPAVLAKQDKDHKDLPPGLQKKAARVNLCLRVGRSAITGAIFLIMISMPAAEWLCRWAMMA